MSSLYFQDDNFFEIIDSEEKAYFLGFLYADGYVNDNSPYHYAQLTIHPQDVNILYRLKEAINSNRDVLEVRNGKYVRYTINSIKITEDLKKLGCINNKTHKLLFPENFPKEYLHHMIRGYFDGDGCICKDKYNTYFFYLDGNEPFLKGVEEYFIETLGVERKLKYHKRHKDREDSITCLRYGGNTLLSDIYKLLYKDSTVFLERKFNKFVKANSLVKRCRRNNVKQIANYSVNL